MYVSLGGHVILLKYVFNVIPIFFLSILNMCVKFWKKIEKIQIRFSWGGVKGDSKITWARWSDA